MSLDFKPLLSALALCAAFISTNANAMIYNLTGDIATTPANTFDIDIDVTGTDVTAVSGIFGGLTISGITTDFLGGNYYNSNVDYSFAFTYPTVFPTELDAARIFTTPDQFVAGTTGGTNITDSVALSNVIVTAVPEPESYAMFLAGLGLLGFARRVAKS